MSTWFESTPNSSTKSVGPGPISDFAPTSTSGASGARVPGLLDCARATGTLNATTVKAPAANRPLRQDFVVMMTLLGNPPIGATSRRVPAKRNHQDSCGRGGVDRQTLATRSALARSIPVAVHVGGLARLDRHVDRLVLARLAVLQRDLVRARAEVDRDRRLSAALAVDRHLGPGLHDDVHLAGRAAALARRRRLARARRRRRVARVRARRS